MKGAEGRRGKESAEVGMAVAAMNEDEYGRNSTHLYARPIRFTAARRVLFVRLRLNY